MRLGIMQPYFFPYLGYFQLIHAVDNFILYDNVQYRKSSWINRNLYLLDGMKKYFTLPLKKGSTFSDIKYRFISENFDRKSFAEKLKSAYSMAPYFLDISPLLDEIIHNEEQNLSKYVNNSIIKISQFLDIKTNFFLASDIDIDHKLRGQERILAFCKKMNIKEYINTIGGEELYDRSVFEKEDILLNFIISQNIEYKQCKEKFLPSLSILDVLMFNSKANCKKLLNMYYFKH